MTNRIVIGLMTVATAALIQIATPALAGDVVRGRDLMTPQEQTQMRTEMWNATTQAERQALRTKNQQVMQQRAAEQGVTLQHEVGPLGLGRGRGMGAGQGAGMGAGQGAGPCVGRGAGCR